MDDISELVLPSAMICGPLEVPAFKSLPGFHHLQNLNKVEDPALRLNQRSGHEVYVMG